MCISDSPYVYPLMLNQGIHETLVQHNVYVPILWKDLINNNDKNTVAVSYTHLADQLVSDRAAGIVFLCIHGGYLSVAEEAGYDYGYHAFRFIYYFFFR